MRQSSLSLKNRLGLSKQTRPPLDFTDVDLLSAKEREVILEELKKLNPECSFPTILIGDKIIIGYEKEEIKAALGLS
jgi:glutaredoxin